MDYSITAKQLLEKLGGEKNISSVTHCMTRLRFFLKEESIVNDSEVEKIPGVMGIMKKGGQYQVIIGNNVAKCFAEIQKIASFSESTGEKPKQNAVNTVLDFIAGCMTPMISAIIAGGLIKVLLVILGPTLFGWLATTSDTYIILNAIGDSAFYFLPVFVALTAAKKLGCNLYLSIMVSAMLIYPDITTLLGGDAATHLFGVIPVTHGNYASSVIPAMLAVILLKYVEKCVDKITPEWSKNFLKPLLIVIIVAPITLCVLAPVGLIVGQGLQFVLTAIYGFAPWLAMGVFAGLMPFIVMTGMHWAFVPATLLALSSPGYELLLLPAMLSSNLAQSGASLAVAIKSKDTKMKQVAFPAAISAVLAGVTEPAMYGVTLKLKKPMYAACIASAIGGVITGFVQLKAFAFATPCLTAIVQFVESENNRNFIYACIIGVLVFTASFILTLFLSKKELNSNGEGKEITEGSFQPENRSDLTVETPITGKVIPLADVNDATFSSEVLGKGYAVIPDKGEVYAPFDGTVETIMDTCHALGLVSDTGIEILVHVGLETVELNGKYFEAQVKTGKRFHKGDLLLKFDLKQIADAGYDVTTPVIVTNQDDYVVEINRVDNVKKGMEVLTLKKA